MKVKFYQTIDDHLLKFAVIVTKYQEQWVFVKHKERETYEVPGGHRETYEPIEQTARRELYEETGASSYELYPICVYSVTGKTRVNLKGDESYGMLYYAKVSKFSLKPDSEIEDVCFFHELPTSWTYPQIQPLFIDKVKQTLTSKDVMKKL